MRRRGLVSPRHAAHDAPRGSFRTGEIRGSCAAVPGRRITRGPEDCFGSPATITTRKRPPAKVGRSPLPAPLSAGARRPANGPTPCGNGALRSHQPDLVCRQRRAVGATRAQPRRPWGGRGMCCPGRPTWNRLKPGRAARPPPAGLGPGRRGAPRPGGATGRIEEDRLSVCGRCRFVAAQPPLAPRVCRAGALAGSRRALAAGRIRRRCWAAR